MIVLIQPLTSNIIYRHVSMVLTSRSRLFILIRIISQISFISHNVTVMSIIVKMLIRTVLFLAGLATALTQISTIINCVQPDLVNYLCVVCKPNFQLTGGQCRQCLPGFTLNNGNCLSSTTTTSNTQNASPTAKTATTSSTQATNSQSSTNATNTASQLNTILQLIATDPALAAQLQPILLQLLAQNNAATPNPTTTPTQTSSTTTSSSTSQTPKSSTTTTPVSSPTPTPTLTSTTQTTGSSNVFLPFASQPIPSGSVTASTSAPSFSSYTPRPQGTDWNCKRLYPYTSYCAECYTGFYVNQFTQTCMAVNPNCQNVTSNNLCSSCYPGYTLTNGNCYVTPYNPLSNRCKTIVQGICQECYTGYYLNFSSNTCDAANPKCMTLTVLNTCASCYQGYQLVNDDCIISNSPAQGGQYNDNNCKTFGNNEFCVQCVARFVIGQSGICVLVDPFCQNYTSTGVCLLCYVGYKVSNGACVPLTTGGNTLSNDWIQCPFRTIPRPGFCQQVSDQCNTWSNDTGLCLTCYLGYEVNANGECVVIGA